MEEEDPPLTTTTAKMRKRPIEDALDRELVAEAAVTTARGGSRDGVSCDGVSSDDDDGAYWMPAMDMDYWDDVDDIMGTEFGSAAEALMAFREYAKLRMFEPVKQSETRLGCRWRGCQFGLEFDSPELREIIREESICSHSHRDEPGRGVVSELQIQYGLEKKRPRPTSKPAVNIASFLSFSLKCGRFDDAWVMRAAWMLLHRGVDSDGYGAGHGTSSKKLPGMGGNAGPAYSSSGKFHRAESSGGGVLDIPGFPWYGGKHGVRAIDRFRKAHFERGAQSIKMSSESVVRTEDMTLDEMARELTADDASYLRWWAASAVDSNLKFLCVAGTSAFALERTLMMLQFTHGVFNRAGSGAPFRNTPEYRSGNIREKKWERQRDGAARHAVFLPGDLRLVDTRCYLAIDACALESVRLESLMYIPLHMRMPASPLLLQAWARSWGTESEVRLHAISATINFFVQHMTQAHDSTMRWVHPIWSPAFALYDMLPEFLTLVRGHRNAHILSLLRESVLDGAHAEQHDSMGQTILAFILQKQHHILTRRMYNMLRTIFDKSYDIRVAHPIVAALFRYYKQCPTVAQLNPENSWVDFFLPSWDVLDLDSVHEKLRPRLPVEECRPHHFFYLLCFDTENFTEHLRDDLARSFSIDDYSAREGINVLHRPSFNFSNKVITADQVYTSEFRDYLKHCAIPGAGGGGGVAAAPHDYTRKKQFFSNDVRDALPLGNLHLVMSAVQHLSWNPPPPYSTVKSNPNLVHELMPPSSYDPRLDPDNMVSVVRMGNILSFVTSETPYDMPVARTEYFCPTPEVPERRPFPRQPAAFSELDSGGGDGPKKQKQPPKTKQRGGRGYRPKTASLMPKPIGVGMAHRKPPFALADDEEEVLYMSEWLLSFPLKTRPSEASVGIAELDAFLLVRDPAYLEYREACGDPIMSQSMQRREFPKEGAEE